MEASVTEQLARFIGNFEGSALPKEAIHNTKVAILDCIGVALAGSREPVGRILCEFVQTMGSQKEATIWGTDHQVSSLDAALVNGVMSHALDYDDSNRSIQGHPSAVLVPAVFAAAERVSSSGRRLLEGYIVGFEVMARLGQILNPGLTEKGWHPTSILGTIGACASTSYLLHLGVEEIRHALGIAASEASGIKKNFGTMVKPLHAGSAARKGIWAVSLAEKGLTANPEAIDGTFGFLELFQGNVPFHLEPLDKLGRPLEIIASGLVIKPYPCCASIHSTLDIILDMKKKESIRPDQVKEIECRVNPQRIPYTNRPQVRSGLEGKFSFQYCIAAGLVDGHVGLAHFTNERVMEPEIRRLMEKVRLIPVKEFGMFASEVTLKTWDGQSFSKRVPEAKGSPALPLSESEVFDKFMDCATMVLPTSQAEQVSRAILDFDHEDVSHIIRLLKVG